MSNFDPFANGPDNGQQQNNQQQNNQQPNGQQPNGQQQFYGQQPYGQMPYGQMPYGQPPQVDDHDGKTAKFYGIIAIVLNVLSCCLPAGIILGIMALVRAGASRKKLGYQSSDAHLGKVLGIISIIWGALTFIGSIIYVIFVVMVSVLEATGGGTMV